MGVNKELIKSELKVNTPFSKSSCLYISTIMYNT